MLLLLLLSLKAAHSNQLSITLLYYYYLPLRNQTKTDSFGNLFFSDSPVDEFFCSSISMLLFEPYIKPILPIFIPFELLAVSTFVSVFPLGRFLQQLSAGGLSFLPVSYNSFFLIVINSILIKYLLPPITLFFREII